MDAYQSGVLLLSGALGVTELFARKIPQGLVNAIGSAGGSTNTPAATADWKSNGGAILLTVLFVGLATYLAGLGDDAGKLILVVVIAVWILFLVKNASNLSSIFSK